MFSIHTKDKYIHLKFFFLSLSIILLFFSTACNPKKKSKSGKEDRSGFLEKGLFNQDEFAEQISVLLPWTDTTDNILRKSKMLSVNQGVKYAYTRNEYKPFWVQETGLTDAPEQLTKELEALRWDGLDPEKYRLTEIQQLLKEIKATKHLPLEKIIRFDTLCTRSYLQASNDLLLGTIIPRRGDSLWFHANDSTWKAPTLLVGNLGANNTYPSLKEYRSKLPAYTLFQKALQHCAALSNDSTLMKAKAGLNSRKGDSLVYYIIKAEMPELEPEENDTVSISKQLIFGYQFYNGIKGTGKLDSATIACLSRRPDTMARMIATNMERLRWLPTNLEDTYILVNIPMMELFFRKDGLDVMHFRVVVGRPSRQTPALNAKMVNIIFNPSWGVPPTILKKDVLPGLTRGGGSYLSRKGLHAFDHNGNPVDAGSINESNYRNYVYRQPPGDRNALGVIKFNLPNRWDVYMHDTPHKEDFPNRYRAKSSGCIRLQYPREMAEYILTQLEGRKGFDQNEIDTLVRTHRTKYKNLKNKIPVHILYLTAMEDSTGKMVRFANDIYNRDNKLSKLLGY